MLTPSTHSTENERVHCKDVFTANRFGIQIHFEHLPPLYECANLANIRTQASLIGEDGLAAPLGNTGKYAIQGFREVDVDDRDSTFVVFF